MGESDTRCRCVCEIQVILGASVYGGQVIWMQVWDSGMGCRCMGETSDTGCRCVGK